MIHPYGESSLDVDFNINRNKKNVFCWTYLSLNLMTSATLHWTNLPHYYSLTRLYKFIFFVGRKWEIGRRRQRQRRRRFCLCISRWENPSLLVVVFVDVAAPDDFFLSLSIYISEWKAVVLTLRGWWFTLLKSENPAPPVNVSKNKNEGRKNFGQKLLRGAGFRQTALPATSVNACHTPIVRRSSFKCQIIISWLGDAGRCVCRTWRTTMSELWGRLSLRDPLKCN